MCVWQGLPEAALLVARGRPEVRLSVVYDSGQKSWFYDVSNPRPKLEEWIHQLGMKNPFWRNLSVILEFYLYEILQEISNVEQVVRRH